MKNEARREHYIMHLFVIAMLLVGSLTANTTAIAAGAEGAGTGEIIAITALILSCANLALGFALTYHALTRRREGSEQLVRA